LIYRIYLFYIDSIIILEWVLISINSLNIEIIILIDWVSLLFISLIILISSIIIVYRYVYIFEEVNINRFVILVNLFILSIILIVLRPNIVSILFGWDGLGLVSYCLVIFYQNYRSYNSGIVTVLCNRIGDVGLLMSIGLLVVNGRWNLIFRSGCRVIIIILLIIAAITKSAQIPFSMWLPIAIAAPTPVSALVHSSTLVTAGVYLIIRFREFLLSRNINMILYFLAILTIFMAGMIANVEFDLKKIIALSTLRQLGLIMITLRIGLRVVSFYHLLTHAIFKSMLFMCAGVVIHSIINNQDIRLFGNLKEIIPYTIICFFIANMALCGSPFISGFYSKDLIIEMIYDGKINLFMLILILVSLIFTVSYSVRLYYYMFFSNIKFHSYNNLIENNLMGLSMIFLVILSVGIGSVIRWIFFFDIYLVYLRLIIKILTIRFCLLGLIIGGMFIRLNLIKIYYFGYFLGSMWFLNYSYLWLYKIVNSIGMEIYIVDKTWLEFSVKIIGLRLIKQISIYLYKIYIFVIIFIYLFIIIILIL